MANPSLQIGNSNWAIKEENLLGYSTAGTRFVPEPITTTRESAGTRVNSSGLVETVELLGSELVEDGSFPLPNTEWDLTGGAEVTALGGRIYSSSGGVSSLDQGIGMVVGKNYKITLDVIATNGTKLSNPSGANIYDTSTVGSKVFYITAAYSTLYFKRYSGITDVTINNVSVKESTKNNLARVDYDGTVSSLLVEPERTNLVTYSESYGSGTYFSATNGSVIDNTTSISPSGENNATQITSTGAGKLQSSGQSLTQNTDYVLSFYAKNVDATEVKSRVLASGGSGGENLTSVSYISELSTTEWTRITHIFNTGTNTTFYVFLSNALNSGGTIQLWGAQLEEATYATSYIPTDGGTVTRVQDQYSKTGISNLINSEEGVLFVEMAALSNDLTNRSITISDGSTNNIIQILFSSVSNTIRFIIRVGGVGGDNLDKSTSSYTVTDFNKVALKWEQNNAQVWINGTQLGSPDTNSDSPTGLNDLSFEYLTVGNNFYGKVKQLQVFKTALTDPELVTLTTI